MLQKYKKLVGAMTIQQKAAVAYIIASVLTQGINFITLPIYTRLLSTAEMGSVTVFNSWYAIAYAVVTLSLTSGSLSVAMMEFEKNRNEYQSVCLALSTLSALGFGVICLLLKNEMKTITGFTLPVMVILIMMLLFNPALESWYLRQRYEYRYKNVVVVSAIIAFFSALIPISLIIMAKKSDYNYNLGEIRIVFQYGITILAAIVFYVYIMIRGKIFFNKKMMSFALMMSLPLIIHTLAKNLLDASDRLMIGKLCGNSEAGIYGTVYNISMLALIVWNAINAATVPYIFDKLQKKKYEEVNNLCLKILFLFAAVSIVATLVGPEILEILTTSEYYSAVYMIPAIAAGIYFTAVYGIYGNMILYAKKSVYIMVATSIAAVLNIILNYICIKYYGYMAAAYTTLISFAFLALLQGIMQRKIFEKEIVEKKYIIIISIITVLSCLGCFFLYKNTALRYSILGITTILFAIAVKKKFNIIRK